MLKRKVAISIDQSLFERADKLAQRLGVSRSRLYKLALEAYVQQQENQRMLAQLNQVYGQHALDAEDQVILIGTRRAAREML